MAPELLFLHAEVDLIFPPQRSSRDFIRESLRKIHQGVSWSGLKGFMPIDVNYQIPTSCGLPFSINSVISGLVSASLDGNITIQVFSKLVQKYLQKSY